MQKVNKVNATFINEDHLQQVLCLEASLEPNWNIVTTFESESLRI